MKRLLILTSLILLVIVGIESWYIFASKQGQVNPIKPIGEPLLSYTFKNLKKTNFPAAKIALGSITNETTDSFSQVFYFWVPKTPGSKTMLKVSGLMNIPKKPGNYPVIVMFRGFITDADFTPGAGTQPSAAVFAKNEFITLAPDFLGFGESDKPSVDPFENRFQTYTTALSLLASIKNLNKALSPNYGSTISANLNKIGIWGHSNGGQIALSALAISGVNYPTVLWAPVSTSFPYSILYYTSEALDQGKALRRNLAGFENVYNCDDFSPSNFYAWVKAPIQINQGLNDKEVPYWWSQALTDTLKKDRVDVSLNTYPNSDHNLLPDGWNSAVSNSVSFYNQQLSK